MQVTRVNATHAEDNRVVFNVRSCMHFVVTYKEKKKKYSMTQRSVHVGL